MKYDNFNHYLTQNMWFVEKKSFKRTNFRINWNSTSPEFAQILKIYSFASLIGICQIGAFSDKEILFRKSHIYGRLKLINLS